jgi:prophage regulatory protein
VAETEKLYLRPAEVLALGIAPSKPTLWRWISEGKFPKPIALGPQVRAFKRSDIDAWLTERAAATAT